MLFNWLDRNLLPPERPKEGLEGEIWLIHSGGFYEIEKKSLAPGETPRMLHWFKWQAYTTWLTGFSLLVLVYYMSGGAFLVDPSVADLTPGAAAAIGIGVLVGGYALYDLFWRSPLGRAGPWAVVFCFVAVVAIAFGLTKVFSGRAAYLHVGAMLGSIMAANVFFTIIPSQRALVAATKAGRAQEPALALRAKQRSIHNNYMTFPVLFLMVSHHFSATYSNPLNWVILSVLILAGAAVRHFMNIRFSFKRWLPALLGTVAATLGLLFLLLTQASGGIAAARAAGPPTSFTAVRLIIQERCVPCHSAQPTDRDFPIAPNGVMLDTPEQIQRQVERIKVRSVLQSTMPLANKTGMTQEERDLLGKWILEGARVP